MSTQTSPEAPSSDSSGGEVAVIRAHNAVVKKLGPWTTARRFDVRASDGFVVLDLLLAQIEPSDIEITLDINRSSVKLLVPDSAIIDADELRRVGRARVRDWTGSAAPGGRTIRLLGEMRASDVRIHRGGVAILSLVFDRRTLGDVRRAHRDGRLRGGQHGTGD